MSDAFFVGGWILLVLMLVLLIDCAWGHFCTWREKQAMRIRDRDAKRWNIVVDLRGTKELDR